MADGTNPLNPASPSPLDRCTCLLEVRTLPPPLCLISFELHISHCGDKISPRTAESPGERRGAPALAACLRPADLPAQTGVPAHYDVRWSASGVKFEGRLRRLPATAGRVQELLMYDDDINYYGAAIVSIAIAAHPR